MGDQPFGVDRIAVEAAADQVVHASGSHAVEREAHHLERVLTAGAEEKLEGRCGWEFRRAAEAAVGDLVELAVDPEALLMDESFKKEIQRTLTTLTPREEKIICMRFGIREKSTHTLEETGKVFGITRERIRQIEAIALRKLRRCNLAGL